MPCTKVGGHSPPLPVGAMQRMLRIPKSKRDDFLIPSRPEIRILELMSLLLFLP